VYAVHDVADVELVRADLDGEAEGADVAVEAHGPRGELEDLLPVGAVGVGGDTARAAAERGVERAEGAQEARVGGGRRVEQRALLRAARGEDAPGVGEVARGAEGQPDVVGVQERHALGWRGVYTRRLCLLSLTMAIPLVLGHT